MANFVQFWLKWTPSIECTFRCAFYHYARVGQKSPPDFPFIKIRNFTNKENDWQVTKLKREQVILLTQEHTRAQETTAVQRLLVILFWFYLFSMIKLAWAWMLLSFAVAFSFASSSIVWPTVEYVQCSYYYFLILFFFKSKIFDFRSSPPPIWFSTRI